jgi:hypothetical protein
MLSECIVRFCPIDTQDVLGLTVASLALSAADEVIE